MSIKQSIETSYLNAALGVANEMVNARVEDSKDSLFDIKSGEIDIRTLTFMKQTRLADLIFEEANGVTFAAKNRSTGESITFSDRVATNGELRSDVLRDHLNRLSAIHPQQSLYDGISSILRSTSSDIFTYFLGALPNFTGVEKRPDIGEQFVCKLRDEILAGRLEKDSPADVVETIYHNLPLVKFFNLLTRLDAKIEAFKKEIKEMPAENSEKKSQTSSALASAQLLKKELNHAINDLLPNKIAFKRACTEAADAAQKNLAKHRGWKQFFADLAYVVVSVGTLGVANLISYGINNSLTFFKTKTESERLVDNIKDVTKNLS